MRIAQFLVPLSLLLVEHLPRATGYGWCSLEWGWDPGLGAATLWAGDDAGARRFLVTYVNGIYHTREDWERLTRQLEALFEYPVRPFYNPTSGWWLADASRAGYHLVRRPSDDQVVRDLARHLRQALKDVGPHGRVLHLAHSGGALLTYLAAKHHLTADETARVDVASFGGARSITRKYFKGRTINYYARNDPIVYVDRRAASLMKFAVNQTYQEVTYAKHNTTFVFLEGRANNALQDHSLEGPTYIYALEQEAAYYRRRLAGSAGPLAAWDYEISGLRYFRKLLARQTGWRHLTDAAVLRSFRKRAASTTGLHGFFSGKSRRSSWFWSTATAPAPAGAAAAGKGNGTSDAAAQAAEAGGFWGLNWLPRALRSSRREEEAAEAGREAKELAAAAAAAAAAESAEKPNFWQRIWRAQSETLQDDDESGELSEVEESSRGVADKGAAPAATAAAAAAARAASDESSSGGVLESVSRLLRRSTTAPDVPAVDSATAADSAAASSAKSSSKTPSSALDAAVRRAKAKAQDVQSAAALNSAAATTQLPSPGQNSSSATPEEPTAAQEGWSLRSLLPSIGSRSDGAAADTGSASEGAEANRTADSAAADASKANAGATSADTVSTAVPDYDAPAADGTTAAQESSRGVAEKEGASAAVAAATAAGAASDESSSGGVLDSVSRLFHRSTAAPGVPAADGATADSAAASSAKSSSKTPSPALDAAVRRAKTKARDVQSAAAPNSAAATTQLPSPGQNNSSATPEEPAAAQEGWSLRSLLPSMGSRSDGAAADTGSASEGSEANRTADSAAAAASKANDGATSADTVSAAADGVASPAAVAAGPDGEWRTDIEVNSTDISPENEALALAAAAAEVIPETAAEAVAAAVLTPDDDAGAQKGAVDAANDSGGPAPGSP